MRVEFFKHPDEPSCGVWLGKLQLVLWYGRLSGWWIGREGSCQNLKWKTGLLFVSAGWLW